MRSQLVTMITLLAASTFALSALGEPRRKPRPSEERRMKIVQLLLSAHQAKQQVLKQVKYQTLKQQKQIASELAKIVADPQSHRRRPESVKAAISLLGELRAQEGVDVLATYIGFPFVYHPEAGRPPFGVGILYSLEASLPAVPALASIGKPCIDAVIAKLSKTDRVLEQNACIRVLKALGRRSAIRKKLKNAITKAPPRSLLALQIAINVLDGRAVYSKTVRLLLPENPRTLRDAKKQIVGKWKRSTSREKRQITSELSRIVADPENHVYRPESVREAMSLLGESRALDGIDVLVEYIGFPFEPHPDAGIIPTTNIGMFRLGRPIAESHPAVPALINIGPKCIDAVVAKLSSTDYIGEHKACTVVLTKLQQNATIRKKLQQAIPKTLPRRRAALRKALEALDEKQPASTEK